MSRRYRASTDTFLDSLHAAEKGDHIPKLHIIVDVNSEDRESFLEMPVDAQLPKEDFTFLNRGVAIPNAMLYVYISIRHGGEANSHQYVSVNSDLVSLYKRIDNLELKNRIVVLSCSCRSYIDPEMELQPHSRPQNIYAMLTLNTSGRVCYVFGHNDPLMDVMVPALKLFKTHPWSLVLVHIGMNIAKSHHLPIYGVETINGVVDMLPKHIPTLYVTHQEWERLRTELVEEVNRKVSFSEDVSMQFHTPGSGSPNTLPLRIRPFNDSGQATARHVLR